MVVRMQILCHLPCEQVADHRQWKILTTWLLLRLHILAPDVMPEFVHAILHIAYKSKAKILFCLLFLLLLGILFFIGSTQFVDWQLPSPVARSSTALKEDKLKPNHDPVVIRSPAPLATSDNSSQAGARMAKVFSMGGLELFQAYVRGLASSALDDRITANLALAQCQGFAHPVETTNRNDKTSDEIKAMTAAKGRLIEKCKPFQSVSREQLSAAAKALSQSIYDKDSPLFGLSPRRGASENERIASSQALRSAFEKLGPEVLVVISGDLGEWLNHHLDFYGGNGLDQSLFAKETLNHATSIALCQLGFDCSSGGYLVDITCNFGDCRSDYVEAVVQGLSADQRSQALLQGSIIAEALKNRNFKALGLLRNGR